MRGRRARRQPGAPAAGARPAGARALGDVQSSFILALFISVASSIRQDIFVILTKLSGSSTSIPYTLTINVFSFYSILDTRTRQVHPGTFPEAARPGGCACRQKWLFVGQGGELHESV